MLLLAALLFTSLGGFALRTLASSLAPEGLDLSALRGSPVGGLESTPFTFRGDGLDLRCEHLSVALSPAPLTRGAARLRAAARDCELRLSGGASEPETAPLQLPTLRLPRPLALAPLKVENLRIFQDDEELAALHGLQLGANLRGSQLSLGQLSADGNFDTLQWSLRLPENGQGGELTLDGPWPLDLALDWRVESAELPPVDGQSRFSGSLQQLEAELDFRSATASTLAGSLTGRGSPLDPQQPFDLRLDVESADLGALGAAETAEKDDTASPPAAFLEGVLRGQLEAQGEGGEASFQGDLVLTPAAVSSADGSILAPPALQLELRGLASTRAITVETLTASWDEGKIQGQGTLTLHNSNDADPGDADPDDVDPQAEPLNAESFEVASQPLPRLDASLSVGGLDPQRFLPQAPPGALDLRAVAVDWSLDPQNPQGRIQLESLSGTLQGQPVEGRGEVLLSPQRWLIEPSQLRWGGALAQASGNLEGERWDLLWSIAAPDLDSLDPRLGGSFSASGTLQGPQDAPRWRAQLRSQGLQLPGLAAQELRGEVDFVHSPTGRADAQLTLRQVSLGEELEISAASLRSTGRVDDHRLSLDALVSNPSERGEASSVALALLAEGAWEQSEGSAAPDGAASRWSGRLLELALSPKGSFDSADSASVLPTELPSVSLREASEATFASDGSWRLGETCLAVGDGQLCVTGEQRAEGALDAALQLRQLPLQWARPWLPQELTIHGALDGSGALRGQLGNGGWRVDTADLELNLIAGELEWSGHGDDLQDASGNALSKPETESGIENLRWPITAATLTARRQPGAGLAVPGSLVADLSLDLGPKGRLTAHGELAEPAGAAPWTSSSLRASLRGELHDFLPLVSALDPLDSLEGTLHLDLAADGSLGSPRWAGEVHLNGDEGRVLTGSPTQGGAASSLLLNPLQAYLELRPDGARLTALAEAPDSGLLLNFGAQLQQPAPSNEDPGDGKPRDTAASSSSWIDETLNAPLQGRLVTRIPDLGSVEGLLPELRELSGSARGEVFLGGSLRQPELRGSAQLRRGRAQLPLLGITLSGADLDLELQGPQQLTLSGQVSSGGGRLQLNGTARRTEEDSEAGGGASTEALIQITSAPLVSTQATADQAPGIHSPGFQLVDLPEAKIWGHPDLEITANQEGLSIQGELTIPKARFDLDRVPPTVPISDDVVFVTAGSTNGPQRLPIRSEVRLVLGEDVRVQGVGARSRLEGELDLREDPGRAMLAAGELTLHEGRLVVAGQRLEVDRGRLLFTGGPADNPGLDLEISRSRRGGDVRATLRILGTADEPLLQLFTDPPSSEEDALAYLLFGAPLSQTSSSDRDLVDRTLTSAGLSLSGAIAKRLGDRLGIDETQVEATSGQESATLFFGEYLSPRLFVAYGIGLLEPVSTFRLRYTLSDLWELRAESGSESSVDLSYRVGTSKAP